MKVVYSYYQQEYFHIEVFKTIWNQLLEKKIAKHSIADLKTKDIFKISPFISLTPQQNELKKEIMTAIDADLSKKQLFIIKGEAGSGKSVLLSSIYNEILDLYEADKSYNKRNYLLVNHDEMLKTYLSMATYLPLMVKKNILKPTSFINNAVTKNQPAHITIIDEGHTLLSSADSYNNFEQDNHLEEIIKRSTKVILVFDEKQFLKLKSYWDNSKLEELKVKVLESFPECEITERELKAQLRMVCTQETIDWINHIVEDKIINPLPPVDKDFELEIFNDCNSMYEVIVKKNNKSKLARMLSTFDYVHHKDGKEYFIEEGSLKLPWNVIEKEAWGQREQTINQVGSIYTIQGFDLNYVGIILGPSLSYNNDKGELEIDISKYQDTEAFKIVGSMKDKSESEIIKLKEKIILNSLNVLLKRPIKGLYIYASDKKLRDFLQKLKRTDSLGKSDEITNILQEKFK